MILLPEGGAPRHGEPEAGPAQRDAAHRHGEAERRVVHGRLPVSVNRDQRRHPGVRTARRYGDGVHQPRVVRARGVLRGAGVRAGNGVRITARGGAGLNAEGAGPTIPCIVVLLPITGSWSSEARDVTVLFAVRLAVSQRVEPETISTGADPGFWSRGPKLKPVFAPN